MNMFPDNLLKAQQEGVTVEKNAQQNGTSCRVLLSPQLEPPSFAYDLLDSEEEEDEQQQQHHNLLLMTSRSNRAMSLPSASGGASASVSGGGLLGATTACICSSTSQLLSAAGMEGIAATAAKTPANSGPDANFLADSLGVSPLYRRQDSQRWQTAAKVYQSSRSQAHSPISGTCAPLHFAFGESLSAEGHLSAKIRQCRSIGSPISLEDIATVNRQLHKEMERGRKSNMGLNGSLELEAIAAVHELATQVKQISVSEILPRTSDLIFLNIKTYEELPYTLELTMKGWRICSTHTDCMNGDYHNVLLHTKYFQNAKQVLDVISPDHDKHFTDCLAERLNQLQREGGRHSADNAVDKAPAAAAGSVVRQPLQASE